MEFADYSRFFFALAFVVGLIWALAMLARRFGLDKKLQGIGGQQGRMRVVDVLHIDPKRKLTIIRADAKEYLILHSGEHAQLIDSMDVKS